MGHPTDAGRMGVGGDQNSEEAEHMRQPCLTVWPTHTNTTQHGEAHWCKSDNVHESVYPYIKGCLKYN